MTRVKICGLTNLRDALVAVEAGADALGFVFAPSPRRITAIEAGVIIRELPPLVTTVGVFVDAPHSDIEAAVAESSINVVQLHGQETPTDCVAIAQPVIKRVEVSPRDTVSAVAGRAAGYEVSACLLDPGAGSGKTFPWTLARGVAGRVIIAGGLDATNVAAAVAAASPYGVDVCSGVELRPGIKDPDKVRAFVRAVREQDVATGHSTNIT